MKNLTMTDMVNVMSLNSGLPNNFCGEMSYFACLILNKAPYKISDKSPYELWKNKRPNLKYI